MTLGRYSKHGKLEYPIIFEDFKKGMEEGLFIQRKHKGFVVLLYYTGIRSGEALRAKKEQFKILEEVITFDVGPRLKHGIETKALVLPRSLPYVDELEEAIRDAEEGERVFPYCSKTGYNIVTRAFPFYPHFLRLNRITNFLLEGYDLAKLHSWTGLTLKALNSYVGLVDIDKMSKSLS